MKAFARPTKLYKYCPVNVWSLRAITEAEVHYTQPKLFNDPLDCSPTLEVDIDNYELTRLLRKMLSESLIAEEVRREIDRIRCMADAPEEDGDAPNPEASLKWGLAQRVNELLQSEFGAKGVLPLSATWSEPLMWSHYADQHRGICIEYDVTGRPIESLKPVNYNAPRAVRAHDLHRWKIDNDGDAFDRIRNTYFYAKAPEWAYEKEWRDINDRAGVNALNFELSAIHFGLRMDFVWRRTIVKLLNQNHDVALYQMRVESDSFALARYESERDGIEQTGVRQPAFKVFGNIIDVAKTAGNDFDESLG